jgi:hypothetical protein
MEKKASSIVVYQQARPLLIFQRKEHLMVRQPEKTRPGRPGKKSDVLGELELTILNYVREYYLLTAWQLVNLRYSRASLTHAQTKLQVLSGNKREKETEQDAGTKRTNEGKDEPVAYLGRRGLYPQKFGNTVQLYYLETPGMKELGKLGYSLTRRHKRTDQIEKLSYAPLIHTLNVNDILIAARNLPKGAPDIRLASWKHDYDLQTTPALVEFERRMEYGGLYSEKVRIVPDGMLDFRLQLANADRQRRRVILPEIDRGTETNIETFKKKICAYLFFAMPDGAFTDLFGKGDKRVVWIVTKGGKTRMDTIKKWCEDELIKQGYEHEFNLFRFTTLDQVQRIDPKTGQVKVSEEVAIDPRTFFLTPVMHKPFAEEPDTLLWKP